jgi:hypothetical protein
MQGEPIEVTPFRPPPPGWGLEEVQSKRKGGGLLNRHMRTHQSRAGERLIKPGVSRHRGSHVKAKLKAST